MKEGNPVVTTSVPLIQPTTTATENANRMQAQIGQPYCTAGMAMQIPAKPIIEPTERSNSPPTIGSAAPIARMPSWAAGDMKVRMPESVNIWPLARM